jgi:hypothetical protein
MFRHTLKPTSSGWVTTTHTSGCQHVSPNIWIAFKHDEAALWKPNYVPDQDGKTSQQLCRFTIQFTFLKESTRTLQAWQGGSLTVWAALCGSLISRFTSCPCPIITIPVTNTSNVRCTTILLPVNTLPQMTFQSDTFLLALPVSQGLQTEWEYYTRPPP